METRGRAAALKRQADGNTESPAKKKETTLRVLQQ